MSAFLDSMLARAKDDLQTIVLPEGDDERTLQAAERILAEGVANLVILGDAAAIEASPYALDDARIVDVRTAEERAEFAAALYELRRHKGLTPEQAEALMDDVLYFGVMMVKQGLADGMVAGACHATGDVLRPSLQILKTAPGVKLVSSFFVMCVPDCDLGAHGTFLFSDCGLEVQPDSEKLAHIAVNSAKSWKALIGTEPSVALLSHSTYGSAKNDDAAKVVEAADRKRFDFVNQIVEYIVHNGTMKDLSVLQEPPFTDQGSIVEVFTDLSIWLGIRKTIEQVNANAIAA